MGKSGLDCSESAPRQPSQPLPGIRNLGQAGVGVLPEVEEFPIVLGGRDFVNNRLTIENLDL